MKKSIIGRNVLRGVALFVAATGVMRAAFAEEVAPVRSGIRSTGTQWINTGYTVAGETVLDMTFSGWRSQLFGCVFGYGRYDQNAYLLLEQNGPTGFHYWGVNYTFSGFDENATYDFHLESGNTFMMKNGLNWGRATTVNQVVNPGPLCIFRNGPNNANCEPGVFTLHGLRMQDRAGGKLVRDFVPCRSNGQVGLYERVEGRFYANAGTGAFEPVGTLCEFDGANLTLGAGTVFSYKDGVTASYAVKGTLTLAGGATLEVEVGGARCDEIAARQIVLAATAENPVAIAVDQVKDGFVSTGFGRTILKGGAFVEEDLARFKLVTSLPLTLAVEKGNLVLKAADGFPVGSRTLRYIRSTGTQYVLTGVIGEADTQVDIEFGHIQPGGNSDGVAIFGEQSWTSGQFLLIRQGNNMGYFGAGGAGVGAWNANADYRCTVSGGKVYMSMNGGQTTVKDDANEIKCTNKELTVFGLNTDHRRNAPMRLYGMIIRDPDGVMLRDFRPCVLADGSVGLWDGVTQKFFGNDGSGRFLVPGEDDGQYPVAYVESTGTQCIDTGFCPYTTNNAVVLEMDFGQWMPINDGVVFGLNRYDAKAYLLLQQGGFRYYGGANMLLPAESGKDFHLHLEAFNITMSSATATVSNTTEGNAIDVSAQWDPLILFAMGKNGSYRKFAQYRLYDLTLWASAADYAAEKPTRKFVPSYSAAHGTAGMYERVWMMFCGNAAGATPFKYPEGFICKTDGTKLMVPGGAITAANLPEGCTEVELANAGTLDSTGLLAYPSLTLDAGKFSMRNAKPETCAIAGTLKLAGGVQLALDVGDTFAPAAVDLSQASRDNPVLVMLDDPARFFGQTMVITGAGLTAADAEKFVAPGTTAYFKVVQGNLRLASQVGNMLIVK